MSRSKKRTLFAKKDKANIGMAPQLPLQRSPRRLRRIWLTFVITIFALAIVFGPGQTENQVTIINNSSTSMVVDKIQLHFPNAQNDETDEALNPILMKDRKLSPKEESTIKFAHGQHRLEIAMTLNAGDSTGELRMSRKFQTTNSWGQRYVASANEQTPRAFALATPLRRAYDAIRQVLPKSMNWLD